MNQATSIAPLMKKRIAEIERVLRPEAAQLFTSYIDSHLAEYGGINYEQLTSYLYAAIGYAAEKLILA